jgi:transposase InsO family protein
MSGRATVEDIAAALGVHRTTVQRRAEAEAWMHLSEATRGGRRHLFPVGALPADVRDPVAALLSQREAALVEAGSAGRAAGARSGLAEALDTRASEAARQAGLARFATLPEPAQRRAEAKAALIAIATRYVETAGLPKKSGLAVFAAAYSTGRIEVPAWIREVRPTVCANSLDAWSRHLDREGLARLAGKHGEHRKGKGVIDRDPAMREFVVGMIGGHPHVSANHVMRGLKARFAEDALPSERTLQRWMETWKARNEQLLSAVTSPDAWRSKYQAAGGDADAHIVRLNQRWEADSTKGDLLLSDGTRHVIVGIIDVWSRRLKLHVSRTSSAAAVASTVRRALLDWGVPEQLGTDNGSDYVSKHVTRVVAGLGIEHDLAPPFTPEHKPFIERAFGTFCRDLVELLPGFIGHSVAERRDIESRRSFAQRLMKQGTPAVDLRMSPEELQGFCDRWCDQVYAIEPHGGLGGISPFQRAASWTGTVAAITDDRALDVLLCPAPGGDGIRTITKKGLRIDGAAFEAPALGGLEGQEVRVLLDEADIGEVFVFGLDGGFIAKAVCPERTGVSRRELAAARKAHQKQVISTGKAAMKAAAKEARTGTLVADIFTERAAAALKQAEATGKVTVLRPVTPHATPDLTEAGRAARAADLPAPAPVSAAEAAVQAVVEADLARPAEVVRLDTPATRFARALEIERTLAKGGAVAAEDRRWLTVYATQPEYRARKRLAADFGEEAALEA